MLRLVDSPDECRRLGLAARADAGARFGAERLTADVARMYEAALEQKHALVTMPGAACR